MEISELEFLEGIDNVKFLDYSNTVITDEQDSLGCGNGDGSGDCHSDRFYNTINILEYKGHNIYYAITSNKYFYFQRIYPKFAVIMTINPCDFIETSMFIAKHKNKAAVSETIRNALTQAIHYSTEIMEIKKQLMNRLREKRKLTVREYIDWHAKLTGCCAFGGREYVAALGLDLCDEKTLYEFLKITIADPVNGRVIRHIFDDIIRANPQYFK